MDQLKQALLRLFGQQAAAATPAPATSPSPQLSPQPWESEAMKGAYNEAKIDPAILRQITAKPSPTSPPTGSSMDPAVTPPFQPGRTGASSVDDELLRKLLAVYSGMGTPGGAAPAQQIPR